MIQPVVQADLVGQGVGVQVPAGAGQALDVAAVAQSGQEHLGSGGAGDRLVGPEGAVALTVDDAQVGAVGDVGLSPVALGVAELGGGSAGAQDGVLAAVQGDGDDLGHLSAGDDPGGIEVGAVFLAVEDAQGDHGGHGLGVLDLILVGEILILVGRTRGDDHHADQHGGGHHQRERPFEVSHWNFLLLIFECKGRITPLAATGEVSDEEKIQRKPQLLRNKSTSGRLLVDILYGVGPKTPAIADLEPVFLVDFW